MITLRETRLLAIVRRQAEIIARPHAMALGKIHKAMSAESILRHCLKCKGWSREHRRDELTGPQRLELLEEVRLYARAWLRHEGEQFVRHYSDTSVFSRPVRDGLSDDHGIERARLPESPSTPIQLPDPGFRSALNRFFGRVKQFVRETIVAGTMALLGPAPLTGEELDSIDRNSEVQSQFFDNFQANVLSRPITADQFAARTESYGNAAWQVAQRVSHESAQKVFKLEARFLGIPKTEHCADCPPLADKGWVPVGTLPPIGETECNGACLCSFRFKETEDGPQYFRGRKGPVPAPRHPVATPLPEPDTDEIDMIAEPAGKMIKAPIAGPPE